MTILEFINIAKKNNAKIYLARGEDDRKLKKFQLKSAKRFLKKRIMKYGESKGEEKILNLISDKEKINIDNLILLQGSTLGIFFFFLLMKNEEQIMIFKPYYPLYKELAITLNKKPIFVDLQNNNFEITFKYFLKNLNSNVKYVIINSPHNPTGRIFDNSEINKIKKYCEANKIYLLLDLVYENITYVDFNRIEYSEESYVLYIKSFSKSYNMTGCRLAYLIASKRIINIYKHYIKISLISIPEVIQKIGYDTLKKDNCYVLKRYIKNREIIKKFLNNYNLDFLPMEGTYYAFIGLEKLKVKSYDFAYDLLKEEGVVVLPGIIFGNDKYIRLSYMCSTKILKKGLNKIGNYLENHFNKLI